MTPALGELIAWGNVAEVYAWGSHAIKLYRKAEQKRTVFREASVHALVESFGLPVPAVHGVRRVGDRWGIVFDRVDAPSVANQLDADPTNQPALLAGLARLQSRVHEFSAPELPELVQRLGSNIDASEHLTSIQKRSLLDALAGMPTGDRLCHGDFHPGNVLGDPTHPCIIDWPDARRGDPAADFCRSYLLLRLHQEAWAEPYLDACCRAAGLDRTEILAWLPFVAAARFAEGVAAEAGRLSALVDQYLDS